MQYSEDSKCGLHCLNEEAVVRALRQAQGPKGSDKRQAKIKQLFLNSPLFFIILHKQNYKK